MRRAWPLRPLRFAIAAGVVAAAASMPLVPARAADAPVVNVPASIDSSGRSDVTDALNSFFAGLPANATVELPAHARYRAEGIVVLRDLKDVTVDGNGTTLFASTDGSGVPPTVKGAKAHWPRLRQHLSIQLSHTVTVRDLSIVGPNVAGVYSATLEGQAGVAIQSSSDVVIDTVSVSSTFGDGFSVIGTSDGVTIRHSSATRIGRQGVAITRGSHVTVEQSSFSRIARTVFDIEPLGAATVSDVHYTDNVVGDYQNFLLSLGGGHAISDVWLAQTRVNGGNGLAVNTGTAKVARAGVHVIDNVSTVPGKVVLPGRGAAVMEFRDVAGLEVRGNRQPMAGVTAVSLSDVCNATITGNDFPGAQGGVQTVAACDNRASASPKTSPKATGKKQKRAGAAPTGGAAAKSHTSPGLVWAGVVSAFLVAIVFAFLIGQRRTRRA